MFCRNFLVICLGLIIISSLATGFALAEEVKSPEGLSGSHAALSCTLCHGDGVWHTAKKNTTICKSCHADQWETLTNNSPHSALMKEGSIKRFVVEFKTRLCLTCHSPHNNDYLRIETVGEEIRYYTFNNSMQLCTNCHFGGRSAQTSSVRSAEKTNTTTTTITTTTTTKTVTTTALSNSTTTTVSNMTTTQLSTNSVTLNAIVTTTSTVNTTTNVANNTASQPPVVLIVPSTLSLPLSASMSIKGYLVPAIEEANILIKSRTLDSEWEEIGVATTDKSGKYEIEWTPATKGIFVLMASYGNTKSEPQTITVAQSESSETQNPFNSPISIAAMAGIALLIAAVLLISRKKGKK